MQYSDIMDYLKSMANPESVKGMARYGINPEAAYGISIPTLRAIAKKAGKNHALAEQLWSSGIHEARILASMVDDYQHVTSEQMDRWARDFNSWDLCDQCCNNLFRKVTFAGGKALEWSSLEEEFSKRAGFVLMACLAVHDKKAGNDKFLAYLPLIRDASQDSRNFVKKAVNWALRQIGKRNAALNRAAIETANEIGGLNSGTAKWVAADAIRELTSQAVQQRLQNKSLL
jgi:3-methyladenine DNA glycosylase AlkD